MLPFQDSLSQRQEPPWIQRPQVPQQGSWVTEPDRRLQGPAHLAMEQKGQENPATGPSVQPNWEEGQTDECRLCVCGGKVKQQQTLKAPAKKLEQGSEASHGREGGLGPHQAQPSSPIINHIHVGCSDRPRTRHPHCLGMTKRRYCWFPKHG